MDHSLAEAKSGHDANRVFPAYRLRTPGGKLTIQYTKKLPSTPKCGDTGRPLFGVAVKRPKELMRLSKRRKSVSRCYGGVLSAYAVRNRYVVYGFDSSARDDLVWIPLNI